MEGSCEHSNEPSGSIKPWEILEYLHNWRLLMKGSAPWYRIPLFDTDISIQEVPLFCPFHCFSFIPSGGGGGGGGGGVL
jgi:hypothetical protein